MGELINKKKEESCNLTDDQLRSLLKIVESEISDMTICLAMKHRDNPEDNNGSNSFEEKNIDEAARAENIKVDMLTHPRQTQQLNDLEKVKKLLIEGTFSNRCGCNEFICFNRLMALPFTKTCKDGCISSRS